MVESLKEITGRRYVHLCGSGTAAIMFALRAMRVHKGAEVLMPALLCVNPASATIYARCQPSFFDVERETYNLDLDSLEASIGKKTGCIIAVHEHGEPCKIKEVTDICQRRNLPLIEDSAKTLGIKIGSIKVGGFGDISILSFGKGKPIEIDGGGGAVVTDDPTFSRRLSILIRSYPYQSVDENIFYKIHRRLFYEIRDAALTDPKKYKQYGLFVEAFRKWYIRSPLGIKLNELEVALSSLEENVSSRQYSIKLYEKLLSASSIKLPAYSGKGSYVRYPVLVGNSSKLGPMLRELSFDSNEMIPPVNNFFNSDQAVAFLPNSEYLCKHQLILWVYKDIRRVKSYIEIVKRFASAID